MVCYSPLTAYRTPSGGITFDKNKGYSDIPLKLPCNQCIGCRLEKSRQWAVRCIHEASLYDDNCFITLTYNNENLPEPPSLHVSHFQKFMKRLRKHNNQKIRFYHCGEYGEQHRRPHYHALLFNKDFHDKKYWKSINDNRLYVSEELDKLWGLGFCSIGDVTFDSAAYCARYLMKKQTGKGAEKHYEYICPTTGEVSQLKPEYNTMSRRPGIGKDWLELFKDDVYPSDEVIINRIATKPPKYYDAAIKEIDPQLFDKIQRRRQKKALLHKEHQTPERLRVREKVKQSQINLLPRNIE